MFKKKELSQKIADAFPSEEAGHALAVPPAVTRDIASAQSAMQKNKDLAIELARDIILLFSQATQYKYRNANQLTAMPRWDGGSEPFYLTLVAGRIDPSTATVIPSTADLEVQTDLALFWRNLEELAEGVAPITFDSGKSEYFAFGITAPQPEHLVTLISAYMERNRITPLDNLPNHARNSQAQMQRSLSEFNALAAQTVRPMAEIETERLLMIPATGIYQYPEEAILHGELIRHAQHDYPNNVTPVSLQKLAHLSAQARGTNTPLESKGYFIH